jgi:hypothetical protein
VRKTESSYIKKTVFLEGLYNVPESCISDKCKFIFDGHISQSCQEV